MSVQVESFFQSLPRIEIPEIDGYPSLCIGFVTKIKGLVQTNVQNATQLSQRLKGEAMQAVRSFSQNWVGYVMSQKKLNFLLGQRSAIVRCVLLTVTRGKNVQEDDATHSPTELLRERLHHSRTSVTESYFWRHTF